MSEFSVIHHQYAEIQSSINPFRETHNHNLELKKPHASVTASQSAENLTGIALGG